MATLPPVAGGLNFIRTPPASDLLWTLSPSAIWSPDLDTATAFEEGLDLNVSREVTGEDGDVYYFVRGRDGDSVQIRSRRIASATRGDRLYLAGVVERRKRR